MNSSRTEPALRDLGLYLHAHGHELRTVTFLHTSFTHVARREAQLLACLADWIDNCPNQLYSALTYQGGGAWRTGPNHTVDALHADGLVAEDLEIIELAASQMPTAPPSEIPP